MDFNINIKGIPPKVANTVVLFAALFILLAVVKMLSSSKTSSSEDFLEYCEAINNLQYATREEYEKLYSDYSIMGVIKTPGQIYYEIATGQATNNPVTTSIAFDRSKSKVKSLIPNYTVYYNNRDTELVFKVTTSGLVYNIPGFPGAKDEDGNQIYYYTATSTYNPEG